MRFWCRPGDGNTARAVARWRAPVWVVAAGPDTGAMQGLAFSYGVHPVDLSEDLHDWRDYTRRLLSELGLPCRQVLLVAGPSPRNPEANQRLELMVFEDGTPASPSLVLIVLDL